MIIIGIDPGTATTGYGVVEKKGSVLKHITHGAITTPKEDVIEERLHTIYNRLNALLDEYEPEVLALEKLFFGNNVTTALTVGRSVGVIMLAAVQRQIPCFEYRPVEVKLAVTGYGGAEKRQIQIMVKQLLGLPQIPKPDDAADALAIAICHAHSAHLTALNRSLKR
ncbi:crossover junction endodeoxyribonuclease RuvC [Armatimonadota bacterium]|nr:crossover junction endodeoxyribonuclease RuvC [Armatimonadota bacterium]